MTMKELFQKQVIVPINNDNKTKFIMDSSSHITNIKLDTKTNFIQFEQTGIVIKIEKVETSCLSQLKSYLKIIGISYLFENTNTLITVDVVETIIKNNHIFNNITIISRYRVIKISSKLDMIIIWLDI